MGSEPPRRMPLWARGTGLLLGASLLIWLPIEDTETTSVLLLSAGLCGWLLLGFLVLRGWKVSIEWGALAGAGAGLASPLLAVFLTIFKGGLHSHGFLDFTWLQIRSILGGMPGYGLAGLSTGLLAAWLGSRIALGKRQQP